MTYIGMKQLHKHYLCIRIIISVVTFKLSQTYEEKSYTHFYTLMSTVAKKSFESNLTSKIKIASCINVITLLDQ